MRVTPYGEMSETGGTGARQPTSPQASSSNVARAFITGSFRDRSPVYVAAGTVNRTPYAGKSGFGGGEFESQGGWVQGGSRQM